MFVSDFMNAQSTQQLLYTLFCSEMGLLSVAHPATQMEAVRMCFKTLQKNIASNLQEGKEHFKLSLNGGTDDIVELSYRTDAELFKKLYHGIALYPGVDDDAVLNLTVYPLVGSMVLNNGALKTQTVALLQSHATRHGDAVAKRMVQTLGAFNLTALTSAIMPVPTSSGPVLG